MTGTLKQLRAWRNLSRKELGAIIGVDQQTIYNWETGRTEPKYRDVLKVRKALELEPTDVILLGEA